MKVLFLALLLSAACSSAQTVQPPAPEMTVVQQAPKEDPLEDKWGVTDDDKPKPTPTPTPTPKKKSVKHVKKVKAKKKHK